MIKYHINEDIEIENLVLDYNGTIAYNGKIIEEIKEHIILLKKNLNIYILTADTYGTAKKECEELGITLKTFDKDLASLCKKEIIESLKGNSIAIGNGFNDIEMFDIAKLSFAILGKEGLCAKLIPHADIIVPSILDAFLVIEDEKKLKATLRS